MPVISPVLPNDGETIDASDVNTPFTAIIGLLNGNLDGDNLAAGTLSWASMGTVTAEIPASAMEDEANLVKFRSEYQLYFVVSGCDWSTSSGLVGAMASGIIYSSDGQRRTIVAIASKTFTASKDTYVSVSPSGTVTYQEVANDGTAPTLGTKYLWLAKVVTDGSGITAIKDFRFTKNYKPSTTPIGGTMDYLSDGEIAPEGWAYLTGQTISDTDSPLNGLTLPDSADKFTRGVAVSDLWSTASTGGEDTVLLTEANLPEITPSTGTLAVASGGSHTHSVSATAASAGSHGHGVNDPGHRHWLRRNGGYLVQKGSSGPGFPDVTDDTQGPTNAATTGISIQSGGAHTHSVSGTAASAGSHTHSLSGSLASFGSGTAHNNIPAYIGLTKIIRIK